jgi:lipopolysaccharide export system permease protein
VPIVKSSAKGIENSVSNEISAMILKSGEFFTPAKNITMYIGRLSANKEMNNFFLEDSRDPNKIKTFTSETAFLAGTKDSPQIVLKNGSAQTYLTQKKSLDILYFKDFLYDFKLLYEKKVSQRSETVREVTTPKLIHLMREVNISENEYEAYAFEIHSRVLQTLLPAVIIMLGFSCLIKVNFSRQMSWTPTIITIIFLILLKLSGDYCEDLTRSGFFGVWGLYLTPVIGGLIGFIILLYPNVKIRERISK